MTTTTISDEQKKNAATLYESLKPLTVAQRKWNERVFWRAPKSLAEPDWSKLWAAARPVIKALQLDCGPWSESFTANQKYVLDFGFQKQLMGRTRLTQHEGHMLLDAIQDLENESRRMAGIKRKPLAELIAEKVVQKQAGNLKQSDWKPSDGFVPAMAVFTDAGKHVPRTTVGQWIDHDAPVTEEDPVTHAVYVREAWLKGRLDKYCPRERN